MHGLLEVLLNEECPMTAEFFIDLKRDTGDKFNAFSNDPGAFKRHLAAWQTRMRIVRS